MAMAKYLLLLVGLALLSDFVQALTCIHCALRNVDGVCESGESTCQTEGNQECFVRKIYDGDKFLYGRQGCSDLCIPMAFFSRNSEVDFMCCNDASFCNKL